MTKKNINDELNEQELNAVPDAEQATTSAETTDTEERDPLDIALSEIEDLKTQLLYKAAEFENFRKRTMSEKAELIINGGQNVVKSILPVLDDMERALAADPNDGWELIAKKLVKALEDMGVQRIDTDNAEFDTDLHEAVALVPGLGDDKKNRVIDCVQTGYKMNDKVIRHAKVAVGQ